MDTLKQAGNFVSDKVQSMMPTSYYLLPTQIANDDCPGSLSNTSKEANKDIAQDSNASIGTR